MSSEKKEFDGKPFKKLVGKGRTDGEIAEVVEEVSPATAPRRGAIFVKVATIGATHPRDLGPRAAGLSTPFAAPATKYFAKREETKNLKAKSPCLSAVSGISIS